MFDNAEEKTGILDGQHRRQDLKVQSGRQVLEHLEEEGPGREAPACSKNQDAWRKGAEGSVRPTEWCRGAWEPPQHTGCAIPNKAARHASTSVTALTNGAEARPRGVQGCVTKARWILHVKKLGRA